MGKQGFVVVRHEIGNPFEGSSSRFVSGPGVLARWLRRWVRFGYLHQIEKHVGPGTRLLEFGCGGGDVWLAKTYRTTGLEIAESAAIAARKVYDDVIVADVANIPREASSFEAAASIFVLEHLPFETAESALRELHRVLVPGGVLICVCDLECGHPMLRFIRERYHDGYREAYVEAPGHLGLRTQEQWRGLVDAAGYEILEWSLLSRFPVLDHAPWVQLSATSRLPSGLRAVGRLARRLTSIPRLGPLWLLGISMVDALFRPLLPRHWAYRLLLVARSVPAGGSSTMLNGL